MQPIFIGEWRHCRLDYRLAQANEPVKDAQRGEADSLTGTGVPLIGSLIGGQQLSLIFTILALTQSAGISFLQGLQSVEESLSCPLWRQRLAQARALIVQGEPIWQALSRCGGFTPLCLQLIRTGESAGALDQMLENLAHHHREQTYQRADSLAAHLEPMMLVITGSLVGILVVAMYLPVFHLGDAIGGAGG